MPSLATSSRAAREPVVATVPGGPWDKDRAFAYCEQLISRHYQLFPVASLWLAPELRRHVAAIYAFARTIDDFADEPEFGDRRAAYLDSWENALVEAVRGGASHPVFVALAETIETFAIPVSFFADMIAAARLELNVRRYPTFEALLRYCEKSANSLGRAVLGLARDQDPDHLRCVDDLSTALMLANFWRHVDRDFQRGRLYLPEEDLLRFGVSEADLNQRRMTKQFRALMQFEVARTRTLLLRGAPLCQRAPKPFRSELKRVWLGGEAILAAIEHCGYDVLNRNPKIGVREWLTMTGHHFAWEIRDWTQL
jgi:squalene synthase HpnC